MNWLVFERATGVVVGCIISDAKPLVMDHHDVFEYSATNPPSFATIRITDNGCEPSDEALSIARSTALRAVNRKRDAIQRGGCVTTKGQMQSDTESRLLLSGGIQMAQIALSQGQAFVMGWTMADNVTKEHDAMELIAAGIAMGRFIAQSHATAVALKAAINDAETVEDIEAIDIEGASWIVS